MPTDGNKHVVKSLNSLHGNTTQWLHVMLDITAQHHSPLRAGRVFD